MELLSLVILSAAALGAATVSGFLGMAGGISLLAVMTAVMPAGGIIPIHGIVQLTSNSARTVAFLKHVSWRIAGVYCLPALVGVVIAANLWSGEKLEFFKPGIGAFILLFLLWRRRKPKLRNIPLWAYAPVGLCSGFLGIFVGATGPFIAPFFLRDDFQKEQVIATKAVCQAWSHFLKIPAFLSLGFPYRDHTGLISILLVCVILGTYLGKWLLSKVSNARFVLIYEAVLAVVAVYLIIGRML
jgi:uncharacterized membrane protein YfcA